MEAFLCCAREIEGSASSVRGTDGETSFFLARFPARWRLRAGSPRGQEASSPSASSRLQSRFACALALADLGSTKSIVFFACAAGGQEDPQAGPSCQSPGPRGRGGRTLPASGLHPSPRRAYLGNSTALPNFVWSNGGWNKFHHAYRTLIYRGHLQFE